MINEFSTANMPVHDAAVALGVDAQTVRLLIQGGHVKWGICLKRPGSSKYSYFISPRKFYEETGFVYKGD